MVICTLANNIIIPNMKQNGQTVVEIWAFQDLYVKPRPLINMHDIITKNNRAHLWTMGYLCTKYDMNPMYRSGDFVFTSSTWQNHIKPRLLCILMIFNVFIRWSSGHYQTTLSCQIWNKTDKRWLKYEHFKIFTLSPAHSLICATSSPKTIGHIFGPWAIFVPNMTWIQCTVLEISCLQACRHTHTYIHTYIHTSIHTYIHTHAIMTA